MKRVLIIALALAIAIGAVGEVKAQVSRAGVIFLLLPPGARASGMGDAFTSIANDATATYWNPAGLGRYPLSPAWFEFPNESGKKIRRIAILENGMPDNNYRQYDTWALLGNDLARYDGQKWHYGQKYYPTTGDDAEDIASRFSGTDNEDSLKVLKAKLARSNMEIDITDLEELSRKIVNNIPADYGYKEDVEYSLETLKEAWGDLTIDIERYRKLDKLVNDALADGTMSTLEFDKVSFAINNAITLRLPDEIYIPYNFTLPDTLTTMASDAKNLYIGTPYGLFEYNGKRWNSYTTADSLVSDDVTAIAFGKRNEIWIGTGNGLSQYKGGKWTNYTTENGLPDNRIKAIAISEGKRNDVWVATANGLAKLQGNEFSAEHSYPLNVGEDIYKIITKTVKLKPGPALTSAVYKVEEYNAFGDTLPETGTEVKIPYSTAIKGDINRLYVDDDNTLWVGTSNGLVSYDGEYWEYHGYKQYIAKAGDDANSIARTVLGPKAPQDRVDRLALEIAKFNELENYSINGGEAVYVYASPLASDIKSISRGRGSKVLVGTRYGTFEKSGDSWKRYVHAGLEKAEVNDIIYDSGEIWFGSEDKLVIHAHSKREMSFMHSNWLVQLADDIYFEYLSYVQNFEGIGTLGAAITFLSYGSQERTGESGESLGTFSSYELAVGISYGAKVTDKLSLGMSAKYINSHLSEQGAGAEKGSGVASSFAVDGGMLWDTPVDKLRMGLTITNIGPDISYIDAAQADPLPRNLTFSLAYRLLDSPYNKLTLIGEASKQLIDLGEFDEDDLANRFKEKLEEVIAHVGAEYWYGTFLALRAGYVSDKAGQQRYPTLGVGLRYTNYGFDFSYIPSTSEETNRLGNIMRFSMTAQF
ncbi:MAG: PorV/PorQ family protein [candidate division Zixibacteria bacterium]|nr:PorV/PorQ family protein [candidate division Zixibacteria bacterium]